MFYCDKYAQYLECLSDKESQCIFSLKRLPKIEELFLNRIVDSELLEQKVNFFFFGNTAGDICATISKRFRYCSIKEANRNTIIENNEELNVFIALLSEVTSDSVDDFIKGNSLTPYSFIASYDMTTLSTLIAKFFTKSEEEVKKEGFFLNMIEPTPSIRDTGVVKIVSRKNYPYEFLTKSKGTYRLASIAAHGNEEILYIGNRKVGIGQEYNLSNIVLKLGINSLFLDSCFGLTFSELKDTLYKNICLSSLQSSVLYRGVKDNSFVECLWYMMYRLRGINSLEATAQININLQLRTTELPMYVCLGSDFYNYKRKESTIEYALLGENIISIDNKKAHIGFCKINTDVNQYNRLSLISKKRIYWCIDYNEKELLFYSDESILPEKIEFVDLISEFNNSKRSFDGIVSLKKSWNKELKNKLVTYSQQESNLALLLKKTKYLSDTAFKFRHKLNDFILLGNEIVRSLLSEIGRESLTVAPFSENYSDFFELKETEYSDALCPWCNSKIIKKRLTSLIIDEIRTLDYCLNCGQIRDLGFDQSIIEIQNVRKENKVLEITILSSVATELLLVATSTEITFYNVKPGLNKINIPIVEEVEFIMVKCFYVYCDKLNMVYKNID